MELWGVTYCDSCMCSNKIFRLTIGSGEWNKLHQKVNNIAVSIMFGHPITRIVE